MDFNAPRVLGRTGYKVGPLGVASSYGAPAGACEEAFERGCNYFYWGFKRNSGMEQAIRNISGRGDRDKLVIALHSYSRWAFYLEYSVKKALKALKTDRIEVLLLGWYKNRPSAGVIDRALSLKEKGLIGSVAVSGHNRKLFPVLAGDNAYGLFHIRYNAAHRGAEKETFPYLTGENRPGVVTYTATRWGHLLSAKKMPSGENPPLASHCYRFVLTNPAVDVCLCGPRDRTQMKEALTTLDLGPLDEEEMELMKKIGDHVHHGLSFF